jgi:hypothetical protein
VTAISLIELEAKLDEMWRDQVKYQHSSTSAEIPKTGQNTRIQRGEQWDLFFFASRFDAVELRSSPRLLATAQNTNCQVRLRGLWAMADALCAES